ncbi:hypothetical protein D3C87_441350 [compost metagenome]
MHFKFIFIALICSSLAACSGNRSKNTQASETAPDIEKTLKKADLLAAVPFRKLPLTDSTNFDNFDDKEALSKELIKKLHLKDIEPDYENFYSRYRLAFSDGIDAVAITMAIENEMKTYLVTYRKEDYQVIDKLQIAYDEIAESMSRTESKLTVKEIEVREQNYWSEMPELTIKKYCIEKSGKFTLVN